MRRREPGEFPERTVALLQTFANQSALAIENARLYADAQRRAQHLEAAAQVARQLTLLHDSDQLLSASVRVIRETLFNVALK